MIEEHIVETALGLIAFTGNALAAIMFFWARKAFREIDKIKEETDEVRLNYLARFDDVKDVMNANHLDIVQRITKLEILFKQYVK